LKTRLQSREIGKRPLQTASSPRSSQINRISRLLFVIIPAIPRRMLRRLPIFILLFCSVASCSIAGPVVFKSVKATFQSGSPEHLSNTIDGNKSNPHGWSVSPRQAEKQSAIFCTTVPINADTIEFTLYFSSGTPNSSIAEFAFQATTDPVPTLTGRWEATQIVRFSSFNATLEARAVNRLRARETPENTAGEIRAISYSITVRTSLRNITGFRLDAFPVRRSSGNRESIMSWNPTGDFVLTEFCAEAVTLTTNVALGAPVRASHSVEGSMSPDALTDGRPATLVHPQDSNLGAAFYYEIDLGTVRAVDHLSLRQRNDGWDNDRFSHLIIQLYDREPGPDVVPMWKANHRADGSYPAAGEVDVLRSRDGEGSFRGRYLRISSDNPIPKSPQLAEVEAYEIRTPELVSFCADDRCLTETPLTVPPRTRGLLITVRIPQDGTPPGYVFRWRLVGYRNEWQPTYDFAFDTPCPPAGSYIFEAQAAHSDGTWDATILTFPVNVHAPFTQTLVFRWLMAASALLFGVLLTRSLTRRRIALLEARSALAEERTRIARDMHDEVGARLAQLALSQDIFAQEYALPEAARESLRQLSRTARQVVASMDEVVWTVDPQNDTLASTAEFLAQYSTTYLAPLKIRCRLVAPIDWPAIDVGAQVRHELILAFKEALQNVVKHAQATEVVLTMACQPQQFLVSLADNGRGLAHQNHGTGHDGLRNIAARIAKTGGVASVKNQPAGGTVVEIRIPLAR
jgi:signal transduction histidine kinase